MYVSELKITDFRNYQRQTARFCPSINVLEGKNAQGKTNLLESIYLASVGKSPRTPRDREMILSGAERAYVAVTVKKDYGEDTVEIVLSKAENKRIAVNGLPISRMGELMGVIPTVYFAPDEMRIVKNAPSDRRRFMDIALCQISRVYFYLLARYNKILNQRNKLLKSGHSDEDNLEVWDMQLVETGSKIIKTRRGFVQRLAKTAAEEHDFLTGGKEKLVLEYESICLDDEIAPQFAAALIKDRERDKYLGYTHSGPHKDDISFMVDGVDLRAFGSQGQQRTASLSLKLAEVDIAGREKGEHPILLLDDVLSELDEERQQKLLLKASEFQTIITCTEMPSFDMSHFKECKVFRVESGKIIE